MAVEYKRRLLAFPYWIPEDFLMDFVSGNTEDEARKRNRLSVTPTTPHLSLDLGRLTQCSCLTKNKLVHERKTFCESAPGLSSMDTETAVVADCIDPDLEVVWQLKQKDKVCACIMAEVMRNLISREVLVLL
ncbi:hypothetical protein E5288_WYG015006 [Bos mutus]|uniref:Uncharacterized protein n=1 Tax=Bos mutus TaxID=72004 RepID=A0A6B0SBB8_9CETA|nr:hypothetical protein [Bos mutus]